MQDSFMGFCLSGELEKTKTHHFTVEKRRKRETNAPTCNTDPKLMSGVHTCSFLGIMTRVSLA